MKKMPDRVEEEEEERCDEEVPFFTGDSGTGARAVPVWLGDERAGRCVREGGRLRGDMVSTTLLIPV